MGPVPIHTSFEETYRQLLFIDNYVVSIARKRNIRRALFFLALTLAAVIIFFFTENNFGAVGVFALPFWWVGFGVYLLYLKWKTHKRRTGILKQLAEDSVQAFTTQPELTFTDEEVSISYAQNVTAVKWSDFRAYLEEEDTVYLFQEHPYLAWSFSEKEIGPAVNDMKELARQKLPLLK